MIRVAAGSGGIYLDRFAGQSATMTLSISALANNDRQRTPL
jgi:hypothetical protein